ncbi:MAG: signal recognition particle-docking protein FtsY [Alphaproteobacteria bacterium]|nr:signal recognition particle-docking protein FtsY [Alphaproteobacteria bacterium]
MTGESERKGLFGWLKRGGKADGAEKADVPGDMPAESEEEEALLPEPPPTGEPAAEPAGDPPPKDEPEADSDEAPRKRGWLSRLTSGLARSSQKLSDGITGIFTKRKLDDEALEELEELLVSADLGPETAADVVKRLAKDRYAKEIEPQEVKRILADVIAEELSPRAQPLRIDPAKRPYVVLVVGVNGTGKTTTIGKLAKIYADEGRRVVLAAGDTFRAAAIEQLAIWGARIGAEVVQRPQGADAAGLAFDALKSAREAGADILLVDTAGRLQNKQHLMEELAKIVRVLRKLDETAPHACLLVLDATTGQNAVRQVEAFLEAAEVTGLVMTKLDGTARGGILVPIARRFGLPIHAIGVGEGADDLRPFSAEAYARALVGLGAD